MVKKYEPIVERKFDFWDNEYSHTPNMKESKNGEFVKIETYNSLLKDYNKIKNKLKRYKNHIDSLQRNG